MSSYETEAEKAERLAKEIEEKEKKTDAMREAFSDSIQNMWASFQDGMETARKSKEAAYEANAENQAANADGMVSPAEAYRMVVEEEFAKKKNMKIQFQAVGEAFSNFGTTVMSGGTLLWTMGGETLEGLVDTATDKDSWKTMAIGGLVGSVLGDSPLADTASKIVGSVIGLKDMELEPGVEEQSLGLDTEEEIEEYAKNNAGGPSNKHVNPGDGEEEPPEKEIPGSTGPQAGEGDDAMNTSQEEFSQLVSRMSQGVSDFLAKSDNPLMQTLGSAIATPDAQTKLEGVGNVVTSMLMGQLNKQVAKMDEKEDDAGIEAPDFENI